MQTVPEFNDSEFYATVERSIGLNIKSNDGPFQPLDYFMDNSCQQSFATTKTLDSNFMLNTGFPDLTISDSENGTSLVGHEALEGGSDDPDGSFCAAADDGPRTRPEPRLDVQAEVRVPAEPGNAHRIVELIESDNFQNLDNSLTAEGREAIRSAVANTGFFQTYEGRAEEVQNHVNSQGVSGILLSIDRDRANENTALGSRPAVILRIPDLDRPKDRTRDAVYRIPLQR